ncbi:MAG: hypothetical protein AAGJ86_03545 [Pseudomonadota bacterium]
MPIWHGLGFIILLALPFLALFGWVFFEGYRFNWYAVAFLVGLSVGGLSLLIKELRWYSYKDIELTVTETGISVTNHGKTRFYAWSDVGEVTRRHSFVDAVAANGSEIFSISQFISNAALLNKLLNDHAEDSIQQSSSL